MKALLNSLRRFSLTGVMVLVALWAGYKLWDYYMDAPWTRDGDVLADVVPIAPGWTRAPVPKKADPRWGTEIKNSIGMKLMRIPPGKFKMGSPRDEVGRDDTHV